jgi:hypothetical protein
MKVISYNNTFFPFLLSAEMSVRMSNLDNERDEDSHEDRGISKYCRRISISVLEDLDLTLSLFLVLNLDVFLSRPAVSNTRFIAAVIERHTHSPERRRRYWGRSGTESDHGKTV